LGQVLGKVVNKKQHFPKYTHTFQVDAEEEHPMVGLSSLLASPPGYFWTLTFMPPD
jgi:hypothetical protein